MIGAVFVSTELLVLITATLVMVKPHLAAVLSLSTALSGLVWFAMATFTVWYLLLAREAEVEVPTSLFGTVALMAYIRACTQICIAWFVRKTLKQLPAAAPAASETRGPGT